MGATRARAKGFFSAAKVLLGLVALLAFTVLAVVLWSTLRGRPKVGPTTGSQGAVRIDVWPRDGEQVRDLKHPILVRFSRPVTKKDVTFSISPDPGGWTIEGDDIDRDVTLKHANPYRGATVYTFDVRVASADASAIVHFTAWGLSSLELIEIAATKGALDLDTAWTYRLQALFEPELLPHEYRSPTPIKCGSHVMTGFQGVRSRLRPETLAKLRPYLLRPDHPDSVFARRLAAERTALGRHAHLSGVAYAQARPQPAPTGPWDVRPEHWQDIAGWLGRPLSSDPITIHGPKSRGWAKINEAASLVEGKEMYGIFNVVMKRPPLSDENETDANNNPDNGGDGNLDIYIVPKSKMKDEDGYAMGVCIPVTADPTTPAWILVDESLTGKDLGSTLAHELFHAFQDAINAQSPAWWVEGTAVWAEDFTDRNWNTEQDYIPDAFLSGFHILEQLKSERELHAYGAYLFPFYLSSRQNDAVIGTIWRACASQDPLDAVDANVQGGLDDTFKKFSKLNYDDVNFSDHYREQLNVYGRHGVEKTILESVGKGTSIQIDLGPLSAMYLRFENHCDPRLTPQLRFNLEEFAKNKKLSVQAIIDPDFDKKEEDWTGLDQRVFCLTDDKDMFASLVLVLGASEREAVASPTLKIEFKEDVCVPHGGTGEYHGTVTKTWDSPIRKGTQTEEFSGHLTFDPWVDMQRPLTGKATVSRKEILDTWEGPYPPNTQKEYRLTESGTSTVGCKLRYNWGWPESDYSVDYFPDRIDLTDHWVEITTNYNGTKRREGSRSGWNIVNDHINYGHHYKAKKGALLLQGEVHERENCDTTGSTKCVQTTDASWSIRLNRPKKQ